MLFGRSGIPRATPLFEALGFKAFDEQSAKAEAAPEGKMLDFMGDLLAKHGSLKNAMQRA